MGKGPFSAIYQGQTADAGDKASGADWGGLGLIGTHTPAERIISRIKIYGEESGSSTAKGRAKQTAKEIADVFKKRFKEQGWID